MQMTSSTVWELVNSILGNFLQSLSIMRIRAITSTDFLTLALYLTNTASNTDRKTESTIHIVYVNMQTSERID